MLMFKRVTFSLGFGIVLTIIGIIVIITKPHDVIIKKLLFRKLPLVNGSVSYDVWKTVDMEFKVYLFHVVNPDEVQNKGDVAILVEYGPYVYDAHLEKSVIAVNETADTIEYIGKRTLFFNATKSGNFSETDEITILNAAYIGTILSIESLAPAFLSSIGNNIPLLFPDNGTIFVRGKVKDILFDGLPLNCNPAVYPELTMVCNVLNIRRPPILRSTSDEGDYAYSFFHKLNGSIDGPYTISRGLKDLYSRGHVSKFKGSHYAEYWNEKECCLVQGSDGVFWAPLSYRKPVLYTFIPDLCKSMQIGYTKDMVYNGLLGYHYTTYNRALNATEMSCYCPKVNGKTMCLLPGLIDLEKCQEAPVVTSEPHFLYGASALFSTIQGLKPDVEKHASFVVVEPLTGSPLSGSRRMQLSMILKQLEVDLLVNVTEGAFPMLWIDEGLTPGIKMLEPIILMHRANRLLIFLESLPFIIGVLFVLRLYWMKPLTKTGGKTSGRVNILTPRNTRN